MKKKLKAMFFLLIPFLCVAVLAQQSVSPYQPTEIQNLRLQVKYKDAQLAQIALQQAQATFNKSLVELTNEGKKVIEENHWPKDVTFDPNTMNFSAPPPKPDEKKKP